MSESRSPSSEVPPGGRPRSRVRLLVLGACVLIVVGVVVALSVAGGDGSPAAAHVDEDAYCLVLSADYETSLRSIVDPASVGQTRDVVVPTVERIYEGFVASAPPQFTAQARTLTEGIDRAIEGELGAGEIAELAEVHADLQAASRDLCSTRPGVTPEPSQ